MDNIQISIIIIIVLCILSLCLKKTAEKFGCPAMVKSNNVCSQNWSVSKNSNTKSLCTPTTQAATWSSPIVKSINNLNEDIFCLEETINDYFLLLLN
jgi:hypothetical protein